MNTGIEKRRHPRIPLNWPVILMTPQGPIKGETSNVSVGGLALILFLETPEIGDEFQITLKMSANLEMIVTCEKIWSGKIVDDESVCFGIGVRFTKISSSDLDIIDSLVAEYYQV